MSMFERLAAEEQKFTDSLPFELGLAGAGAAGIARSKDMITGRKTLHHGTSAEHARNIRLNGFSPTDGTGGVSEAHDKIRRDHAERTGKEIKGGTEHFVEASKGKTHFSSLPSVSDGYAAFKGKTDFLEAADKLRDAQSDYQMLRYIPFTTQEKADQRLQVVLDHADRVNALSPHTKGERLTVNVPYAMYDAMETDKQMLPFELPRFLGGKLLASTTDGDIPSRYIQGGVDGQTIKQQFAEAAEHFPDYIKSHPGRFASGVGLLGGGIGVTGYAGKRIYDRLVDREDA